MTNKNRLRAGKYYPALLFDKIQYSSILKCHTIYSDRDRNNLPRDTIQKKFEKILKKGLTFEALGIIIAYVRSTTTAHTSVNNHQESEQDVV